MPVSWAVFSRPERLSFERKMDLKSSIRSTLMPALTRILAITAAIGFVDSGAVAADMVVPTGHELVECVSVDGDTELDILFQIEEDRYRGVWMVASDPTVAPENSEIARFEAAEGLLSNSDTLVVAHVDLRNPKTGRKGERIGGTVLGALKLIMLDLDVDLFELNASAVAAGGVATAGAPVETLGVPAKFSAQATYFKRNGDQHVQDLDCTSRR